MDKDLSLTPRPTFKRALRRINITSVIVTMTLIWLLLCVASVLTLKQYAQRNLELTAATMTHSLEAALVFADDAAAAETLAALGQQGQFSAAEVRDNNQNVIASWRYNALENDDKLGDFISHRTRQLNQPLHLAFSGGTYRVDSAGLRYCHFADASPAPWCG